MRKFFVALTVAAGAAFTAAPASADHMSPHLHCLATASGNVHAIAQGVTAHGPSRAFDEFHGNVHRGVLDAGHPLGPAIVDPVAPFACP
jgi:hypothetical protein